METFDDIINNSDVPVLVDFWAEWCGPCRIMAPVLEDVKQQLQGRIRIVKVNVDDNQAVSMKYNVRGIPALLLFKRGQVIWHHAGIIQARPLVQALEFNNV